MSDNRGAEVKTIVDILADQWAYDIANLSQWWVIVFVFPALFYFVFMILKWAVLTLPVWLPASIIISAWRSK